jgi:glycosyltransferase involved in cell wall biosynthesis
MNTRVSTEAERTTKVKVLHVIDSFDLGGAQVVMENLVRSSDRARFDVEVAAMHGRGVFTERLQRLGVPIHSLSPHKWLPWYVPRLIGRLASAQYEVVHCHLLGANLIAKPLAALFRSCVRINHDHCNDKATLSAPARSADRWMNRLSSHIIAVSESTRVGLIAAGVAPEQVTTVYNGLDLAAYCPRPEERAGARGKFGIPADAFVIGGIGRLTFQKNFALFVKVATEVCAKVPNAHFVIAGTGPDEAALHAQIAESGLGDRIRLLGFVPDPAGLYPALDVLLLTSRFEGLPMTILEAMACGVAIVASDLDGMREILENGKHASLVKANDAAAFAASVQELAAQPELVRSRVAAALRLVRERFSAEAMTRSVEAIYDRCLRS